MNLNTAVMIAKEVYNIDMIFIHKVPLQTLVRPFLTTFIIRSWYVNILDAFKSIRYFRSHVLYILSILPIYLQLSCLSVA